MFITMKIAFRNVLVNKRRSLLIGLVIFIASFLLLAVNALANGSGNQVTRTYTNLQAADVVVEWETLKKIDLSDPARYLFMQANSFDSKKDAENRQAIDRLNAFLKQHQDEIKAYYPLVRRNAQLDAGDQSDSQFTIYGLTPENSDYLLQTKTLSMAQGQMLSGKNHTITLSKEKADEYNVHLGDKVTIEVQTPTGQQRKEDFVVEGIYANGAGWDNWYGFISDQDARELFQYQPNYFDLGKIYLKNPGHATDFANALDKALTGGGSQVLRSEAGVNASKLFPSMGSGLKGLFNVFLLFLLIVIAIGLRSTIRMNLFGRMQEFGTLRAIGFSRRQCFLIIFYEAFFLSVIALVVALIPALMLNQIYARIGVYVGPGPLSYFGGESLYPDLQATDVITSLVALVFFALVSTFTPGFSLLYQNITDVLAKRMKKVKVMRQFLRNVFKKGNAKRSVRSGINTVRP